MAESSQATWHVGLEDELTMHFVGETGASWTKLLAYDDDDDDDDDEKGAHVLVAMQPFLSLSSRR